MAGKHNRQLHTACIAYCSGRSSKPCKRVPVFKGFCSIHCTVEESLRINKDPKPNPQPDDSGNSSNSDPKPRDRATMERDRARQCINRIIKGRNVSDEQCMATVGMKRMEFVDHVRAMLPEDLSMESFGSKWRVAYVKRPFTQATDENLVAGYNWQNIKVKRKDGIPIVPES